MIADFSATCPVESSSQTFKNIKIKILDGRREHLVNVYICQSCGVIVQKKPS